VHSNLPALEAVMQDIGRGDPEQVWCLGDIVGYGADPDACTALVAEVTEYCLAGNHDLVVRGDIDLDYFAAAAGEAARWTAKVINRETKDYLATLSPLGQREGIGLYHASPRDPVWEYVLSVSQAAECLEGQLYRVCLIGHSHVACHFHSDGTNADGEAAQAGTELDLSEDKWLVNPGSVGQPRDGDARAAWLMLDTEAWTVTFNRVDYDIDRAAAAIRAARLPRQLADRLYDGH
jgi:diadenosine tetraphosphatase ApaH/serine/threonine PP2A family protein phosphatase